MCSSCGSLEKRERFFFVEFYDEEVDVQVDELLDIFLGEVHIVTICHKVLVELLAPCHVRHLENYPIINMTY